MIHSVAEKDEHTIETRESCRHLIDCPNLLESFIKKTTEIGLSGVQSQAQILYLAMTSRVLDSIVSVILKGPSSAGKSFLLEVVQKFFPESAFYNLSASSEKALIYETRSFKNIHLTIFEAEGFCDKNFLNYILRSLLSEGEISYTTVEAIKGVQVPKTYRKEGPTGLITTTTKVAIHAENETRMLSLVIPDCRTQTQNILYKLAEKAAGKVEKNVLLTDWIAFQRLIELSNLEVIIPYARSLAKLVPPISVRLRRDFKVLLSLISSHALLHHHHREKDAKGRVLATPNDYEVVSTLIGPILSAGVEAIASKNILETVHEAKKLIIGEKKYFEIMEISRALQLDRSSVSRRLKEAEKGGFIRDISKDKRYKQFVMGDDLPSNQNILPTLEKLLLEINNKGDVSS